MGFSPSSLPRSTARRHASTFAPCNTDRRARPRSARRDIGRRIRFSSAGLVFADPLALSILGPDADEALARARERGRSGGRCASSSPCAAASPRIRLAARWPRACGRSSYSARASTPSPIGFEPAGDLRVFELDHPATQADKRRRLARRRNRRTGACRLCRARFRAGGMTAALKAAGFDPGKRTFVLWLGVTPYLTRRRCSRRLANLAGCPAGPRSCSTTPIRPHTIEEPRRENFHRQMAERVAARGEPFRCYFDTAALHERVARARLRRDRGSRPRGLVGRYLPDLPVPPRPGPGGHVVRMATR